MVSTPKYRGIYILYIYIISPGIHLKFDERFLDFQPCPFPIHSTQWTRVIFLSGRCNSVLRFTLSPKFHLFSSSQFKPFCLKSSNHLSWLLKQTGVPIVALRHLPLWLQFDSTDFSPATEQKDVQSGPTDSLSAPPLIASLALTPGQVHLFKPITVRLCTTKHKLTSTVLSLVAKSRAMGFCVSAA